jgi:hypothetical protein
MSPTHELPPERELVDTVERVEELILRAQVFAHDTEEKVRVLTTDTGPDRRGAETEVHSPA